MTWEEELEYRCGCPYDAMGDFSVFANSGNTKDSVTSDKAADSR